jgi:transcriptional regulator with XRE-family HTH domain
MSIRTQGVGERKKKAFGELIRSARDARGISQAALARAARTSPAFICQIERGERLPSDRITRRLAHVLGLEWQETLRTVYRLRSPDAEELFPESDGVQAIASIYDVPAVRALLVRVAALNLTPRDIEALARNWNNDVTLFENVVRSNRV